MRVEISDRIKVTSWSRCILDASVDDISSVALWAQPKYELPLIFKGLITQYNYVEFLMLSISNVGVTLRSSDKGYPETIDWLNSNGWAVDEAAERAKREPYVRQKALRVLY